MKSRFIVLIIFIVFLILVFPIKIHYLDGGSIAYKAITYSITKVHRINDKSSTGYDTGTIIKLFGFKIYDNVTTYVSVSNDYVEYPKIEAIFNNKNNNEFREYLEYDNRVVYLANNIDEVYYFEGANKYKLSDYINKVGDLDKGIQSLINIMSYFATYKDGGTTIYISREYKIAIKKMNTVMGDRDIYIYEYK